MSKVTSLIQELKLMGIHHPKVIEAIKKTPREKFVLSHLQDRSYDNSALPIECHQTISQPYIVALTTQALFVFPSPEKILEIGTGSGYQAAILASVFKHVWTIERIDKLFEHAKTILSNLNYSNISFKLVDGSLGWSEYSQSN